MSALTTILHKPIATSAYTFLPRVKSLEIVSIPEFPSSKLISSGESVFRKSVSLCRSAWRGKFMTGANSIPAFRGGIGDEGVGALEQESFVRGSSDFRPNLTASGLESTLNHWSKWLVTALFGAILLWRHDAEALWAAMGSVVNAGLSRILKQMLNQERPVSNLRSDPGMPSSHAQSIFFTAIFAVISMFEWLGASGVTIILSSLTLAFSSYLSWLRVSQLLHTASQVVVGAVIGSFFSILWFWSWDAIVLKAFISYLWVRITVVLWAAGFCLGFLIYIIRYWVMDEN
ncbi:lipid phosphate phosphatase epsilon 1, chloroplastic [Actinidia eriantha]|uniref:lipid phosphate phosphatase epsilon 1, chloroplastic n=1 Tax=Actinidia eriantha TaxID=165200 RepID=UPI00258C5FCB|nr:lipid phosphate phosphatase epsilon 1, chloroplastic [Actinidia eriantha]